MGVIGAARNVLDRFRFRCVIDNVAHAGFTSITGLQMEVAVVTYREGGSDIPYQSPGNATIEPITLETGVVAEDSDLFDWIQDVVDMRKRFGVVEPKFRRTLDVQMLDRDRSPILIYRVGNAWPSFFNTGDLDANADEKAIKQVRLVHEGWERIQVGGRSTEV